METSVASSRASAIPVEVRIAPSRRLLLLAVFCYVAAVLALALADLDPLHRGVALAVVLLSLVVHLRRRRVRALRCGTDGDWQVLVDGAWRSVALESVFAQPWLCVIVAREGRRRYGVICAPDGLGRDAHRRLRVALRLSGPD